MNLDELQIKISIELDDLNKQLKSITKDIDNTLGPKATKKLMADNNKVIKSGFMDMNKTAKTSVKQMHKDITKEFGSMSKDISKSLNKAFELDMRKFNSNLTKSMNDAKSTVRSACNDIRKELNAALNVKANIKVNASASASSNNDVISSSSTAAAIMQSSQYTGAMITKAVNEMIKVSTANTARIETAIKHIESALTSSNHKLNIKADIETSVRVIAEGLQSEIDKIIKNLVVPDVKTSLVLDENIKEEVDKAINNVKAEDITLKANLETNMNLNTNELQNDVDKAIREVSTRDIETSINVDKSHLQDDVSSAIKEIDVPELNTTIELKVNLQNDVNKAIREVDIQDFNATVKLSENIHSELQGEVNSLVSKVEVPTLVSSLEVDGRTLQSSVNEIVSKIAIPDLAIPLRLDDHAFQFGVKDISKLMVPDLVVSFKLDRDSINTLQTNVNEAIKQIKIPPIVVPVEIAQPKNKEINKKNKTKKPGPIKKNGDKANKSSIDIPINITNDDKLENIKAKIKEISDEVATLVSELSCIDAAWEEFNSVDDVNNTLDKLLAKLDFLDADAIDIKLDTSGIEEVQAELDTLRDMCESIAEAAKKGINGLKDLFAYQNEPSQKSGNLPPLPPRHGKPTNEAKPSKPGKPPKPTIMGFGFGAYKNEIDTLVEYAKKAGEKIKKALFGKSGNGSDELAMSMEEPENALSKLNKALNSAFDIDVDEFIEIEKALSELSSVSEAIAKKINKSLNEAFDIDVDEFIETEKAYKRMKILSNSLDAHNKEWRNELEAKREAMGSNYELDYDSEDGIAEFNKVFDQFVKEWEAVEERKNQLYSNRDYLKEHVSMVSKLKEIKKAYENIDKVVSSIGRKIKLLNLDFYDNPYFKESPVFQQSREEKASKLSLDNENAQSEIDRELAKLDKLEAEIDDFGERTNINISIEDNSISKIRKQLEDLSDEAKNIQKDIANIFSSSNGSDELAITIDTSSTNEAKPPKPTIMGFGFGAYKNEIDTLVKYAKKAASTVNKVISDALNPEVGPKALDEALTSFEGKVVSVAKKVKNAIVGIAKAIKDGIVGAFNFAGSQIKKAINAIIDSLKKLGQAITNVAKTIGNFLVQHANIIKAVVLGALSAISTAFMSSVNMIAGVITGVVLGLTPIIIKNLDKVAEIIKKLGTVITNVAKKVKDTLVNAFTTAIDFIVSKFNKLTETVKQVATKMKINLMIAFAYIADVIEDKFDKCIQVIKKVASAVANVAKTIKDTLVNAFTTAVDFIVDKFNKIANTVKQVATKIKINLMITFAYIADVIEDKFNKVFEIIKKVGSAIANVAKTVKNTLVNAFTTAIDFIVSKFNKVATVINNAFTKIKVNLMITFAYIADVIEDKFNKIKDSITKVFKHITILAKAYGEVIAKHLNKILSPIANIAKKIKNNLMITFAYVADIIEDKFNKVLGAIKKVGTSIANVAKKIVQPFKNAMAKVVSTVKNGVDKIKNSIVQGFNKAVDSVKSVIGKITSSVKDGFGKAINSVKSVMSKISSSVKSGFNKAASSVKSAMGRVSSAIKNSFSNIKTSKLYTNISKTLNKAKNAVSKFSGKVRTTLNKAFTGIKTGKINTNVSKALNKAQGAATRFSGKARSTLNKAFDGIKSSKIYNNIVPALNKAKSAVSKFSNKVRPTLNKAFSNIKVGNIAGKISKGLSKAKGALSKFASGCKTIWGKIKQIFSKGANDASRATEKLTSGLKGLLTQVFGFFSIYSLINLGREAITQSQTLAQAEIKLTSLMKQRMGATNDTVTAIRQLIEEQSKLGVVSKTALTRGAEQLSMYVHSAKALKELMPAIANLTAKRGGFMATEDDAEEVATQLGEAIREGTTTPLEQSGIYLTEAEIEKFKHLTTEEARAAYLADVIAENVGDINKALANTPIGAMTQLKNNFKELLSTLGIFLANVLKPIVQWLNTIVVACNNALKALGKLLGFDMTGGATSVGDIGTGGGSTEIDTGGVDSATDSYNDAADAADKATEANEKFKGSLMGFDEINVLSDNTNKKKDDFDPTDITPGEGGQLIPEVGELTEADSIFSKFGDKMKAFMDEILEPFKNAWKLYGNDLKEEWKDLVESFKHFCDSLGKFLVSVWEHGGKEFVQHLAEIGLACGIAAMEIGGEILDSLARLWDHLDPAKNMNTQGFLDALNEVSVKIRDFILGLGDHFESFMANGGQDLLNAFGDLAMNIGEAFVRGIGVGIDALDGLLDHLDPANNPKTKKMLKTWEETFGSIGDMALDFVGLLESTLKNGGQEIINSLGDLGVGILDAAGIVIGEIAKTFSELFKHMDPEKNENSKNMLESFDKFVDSLNDFVDAIAKAFKKFMDSGGREFVKNLGDILAIVADLAFTLGGGIIDLITGFINSFVGQKLIEGVAKALEWFSDKLLGLKDAVQIIKDAFQDVIDIIVGIFEGDGEKVGRAFASLIKNALKLTGELVEWLVQLGMDLVAGLVKGICSLPKLLWEAVKFLFDTIVGFFKELFGIHSPSTVFADLGVNLIEGLIEGIKGMLGAVGDVLSEIGEAIFGWFEDILSSASENWNKLCDETSKKWGELKENVSDKCKDIYEDTKEKWTDIKDKTIEISSDLKDKAVEKYTQLKDKLTDTTDKWRQNSEEKWNKVKEKTSEIVSNLKSTVEEKYTKFKDALTDTMEKWRANSEDKWSKIKSKTTELVGNLKSDVEEKYNTFKENLTNKLETWRSTSEEKWNNIKSKTTELVGNLKSDVEQKYETLKSNLGSKMENLKSDMQTKWENIKSKTTEIVNNLKSEAEKKYGELKTNLGTKLEEVKSEASSKWESIKTTTSTKVREVVDEATKKYGEMKSSFTKKMDEVKTALGPKWTDLKNSVKTNASGIASKVSEGLSNVKQKFTKPFEDAKKAVGEVINSIGRTFKNANWSFPKIKLPHIKVTGEWSFNPPRVPSFGIEWRKRGGIIDGITPIGFANGALQMGGEAGKEMVVPLENTSFTSKIAQAMGQAVDNAMARNMNGYYGSSYNVIDDKRDIVLKINDREFARASINSINKLQRESGRTLLQI